MELYRKAAQTAPSSASVLAASGEGLLDHRMVQEAKDLLQRAKELAPDDPNVERQYARAVLAAAEGVWSLPTSQAGLDYASAKSATLLSMLVPGLGQLVAGRTTKGVTMLAGWVACLAWALLIPKGLSGLVAILFGSLGSEVNLLVLLPLAGVFAFWLAAIYDMNAEAKRARPSRPDRPKPPVDLPYE
ncbi:MAG: hypothetical protein N2109_01440 [Fimbriimonadales bacterium]|nr:hypothetical protein [Fimbriimonadales bacterium]